MRLARGTGTEGLRLGVGRGLVFLAVATLATWAVSRIVSDRWWWSQYPWWVPTWAWGVAAAIALSLSCAVSRRAGRARLAGWIGLAALALEFGLIECRVYRLPGRLSLQTAAMNEGGLRLLFWNPSSTPRIGLEDQITRTPSDIAVIANPAWDHSFAAVASKYGQPWYITDGQFVVLSRLLVRRWGSTTLGLQGGRYLQANGRAWWTDPGHAMWLEVEAGEGLGTIVIWVLDMPSDERLGRWETAEAAMRVIRAWRGPAQVPDGFGGSLGTEQMIGFPSPDLVVGDLNVPRGSASVSVLAPGMREAYGQAGAGHAATYPLSYPLLQIDQILTGPRLKATDYRVINPGVARHWMQWARIEPR